MVNIDKAIIARIKKEGKTFEILVDCEQALAYRAGTIDSLDDVIATKGIFSDVKKGEHASEHDLVHAFKTHDEQEIASMIIKKGDVQLTAEHKQKLRQEKRRQIVALIHRNAIDPKSGLPHPTQRIEMVMDEAKVRIDEFKPAEAQMQDVIQALRTLLPLRVEVRELELVIPGSFAGSGYNTLQRMTKVLRQDWLDDGSLKAVVEIPAGVQEELEDELNKLTKGSLTLKIISKR